MRDDKWLLSRLDYLWSEYFQDIPQVNPVFIKFGRFSKLRLGSIKMEPGSSESTHDLTVGVSSRSRMPRDKTYITITGMFKDLKVPQETVDHTIAHELCHYAHGFSSPHKRLHRFPHEGGVIKREMEKRGLMHLFDAYRKWIKSYRLELKEAYKNKARTRVRRTAWRWI